ncbi:lysosomal proton-coupled steroid conjugate and bile acid symporter SLC46A3-like isoform X3 [Daphnia carinata]|uniref:lysosomal proton-coupled steroid conjugate and bile acid symporter SLC46A3-like isoform X3 n=1 Tax=Daphnia carinata TaxID=120202 RepID=UPI0028685B3E|nr:lysosomal proton-coupled steroid conjugate and bile acid symporter SLC46A3-like isoform X3 [Daphnia carinata]
MGHVTLEPMLFLKMIAEGNITVIAETLQLERSCRINLNFTEEDCTAMDDGNHSDIQKAAQVYQNNFNYYQGLTASILPILVIFLVGSISDRYGRKLPMVIVLGGFIVYAIVYLLVILNPQWPVEVLYTASLAVNATGSWVVFNMAVYSYLADITTMETRTKRMGWMDAVWSMGKPLGTLLGVRLYRAFGYVTVFVVSAIMWLICLIYTAIVIKESVTEPSGTMEEENPFQFMTNLYQTVFKRYPHRVRVYLFLLVAFKLGVYLVQGHQVYLWARAVLEWDVSQYSNWSGASDIFYQIGMVVWMGMASSYHLSDYTVAIFGLLSIAIWNIVLASINGPSMWWLVIVATLLSAPKASIEPALRSLITSIPEKSDVGKTLAFLGLMESIWLMVDKSVYTHLYNALIQSFPQINFVVEGAIACILLWGLILLKRDSERPRDANAL